MLMVVFGSGASYDSVDHGTSSSGMADDVGWQPPLSADLFGDRPTFNACIDEYPRSRALIGELRGLGTELVVERELGRFIEQAEHFPARHIQMAAIRFYLRRVLQGCSRSWHDAANGLTNYLALVDLLRLWQSQSNERLLFVTFNYDTLLEQAWENEVGPIREMGEYLRQPGAQIIKVHGSIDWVHAAQADRMIDTETELILGYPDLAVEDRIRWNPAPLLAVSRDELYVPAIAIPVASRTTYECPPDHLEALQSALASVRRLLVFGWAGADNEFLQMCRTHGLAPERSLVACDEGTDATAQILARSGFNDGLRRFRGGFSDLTTSGREVLATFLTT
jgi:hypothetical protein